MERFNRAERRAQVERLKRNRQFYYGYGRSAEHTDQRFMTERQLGKVVQYPSVCSCPMCGNARRHFGTRSIQEQRLFQDLEGVHVAHTQEELNQAHEAGKIAYSDDLELSENPHPEGTDLNDEWREAFLQAKRNDPMAEMFETDESGLEREYDDEDDEI